MGPFQLVAGGEDLKILFDLLATAFVTFDGLFAGCH